MTMEAAGRIGMHYDPLVTIHWTYVDALPVAESLSCSLPIIPSIPSIPFMPSVT